MKHLCNSMNSPNFKTKLGKTRLKHCKQMGVSLLFLDAGIRHRHVMYIACLVKPLSVDRLHSVRDIFALH